MIQRIRPARTAAGLTIAPSLCALLLGCQPAPNAQGPPPSAPPRTAAARVVRADPAHDLVILDHRRAPSQSAWQQGWDVKGHLKNRSRLRYTDISIGVTLLSSAGRPVGKAGCSNGALAPGDVWEFTAMVENRRAAGYRITGVSGALDANGP